MATITHEEALIKIDQVAKEALRDALTGIVTNIPDNEVAALLASHFSTIAGILTDSGISDGKPAVDKDLIETFVNKLVFEKLLNEMEFPGDV